MAACPKTEVRQVTLASTPEDFCCVGCFQAPLVEANDFFLFPPRPMNVDAGLDGFVLGTCSPVSEHA